MEMTPEMVGREPAESRLRAGLPAPQLHRGQGSARLEGIAEAADRMDQDRARRVLLHFLPQAQHVDVYRAIRDGAVLPPYGVEQLLAAEDYARPVHQKFEQP